MNREDEISLGKSWKPLIQSLTEKEKKILYKDKTDT
jgi:hypothetical protein